MEPGKDKYRLLMEHLPDAFAYHQIVTDSSGKPVDCIFLDVNPAFEAMTGLKKEELVGKHVTEIHPGMEKDEFDWIRTCGQVALTGKSASFEQYFKSAGSWYNVIAYSDSHGYFAVLFREITERKQAEEHLRHQNDLLEGIINGTPDVLAIQNPDYTIERYNQAGYKLLGKTEEEVKHKKCYELLGRSKECDHCATRKALQTKKLEQTQHYFPELNVYLDCRSNPILDENGNIVQIIEQLRDITEQKQMEQQLRESEERFRYIAEFSPLPMSIIDSKGNYEYLNPAFTEVFGYTRADIPNGKMWFARAYPDPDYRQQVIQTWKKDCRDIEKNVAVPRVFTVTCKNGLEKEIFFRTVLMDNGKYLLIYEDITERKLAEQKLADYTQELEQLYRYLDQEINKAQQVHEQTLPQSLPAVENISIAAYYQPAEKMGGDFYDLIHRGNKLIFYLSDVSGHGMDGAMLSLFVKHTINSYIDLAPAETITPKAVLNYLAEKFFREAFPEELYIAIFLAVLDLETLELTYSGAGFQEKPLVRLGTGEQLELVSKGLFISRLFPVDTLNFEEDRVKLLPGSTLFFTTDGLTEQANNGKYFMDRLPDVFYANVHLPPDLIKQTVVEDFRRFTGGSQQGKDDITFLVIKVDGE